MVLAVVGCFLVKGVTVKASDEYVKVNTSTRNSDFSHYLNYENNVYGFKTNENIVYKYSFETFQFEKFRIKNDITFDIYEGYDYCYGDSFYFVSKSDYKLKKYNIETDELTDLGFNCGYISSGYTLYQNGNYIMFSQSSSVYIINLKTSNTKTLTLTGNYYKPCIVGNELYYNTSVNSTCKIECISLISYEKTTKYQYTNGKMFYYEYKIFKLNDVFYQLYNGKLIIYNTKDSSNKILYDISSSYHGEFYAITNTGLLIFSTGTKDFHVSLNNISIEGESFINIANNELLGKNKLLSNYEIYGSLSVPISYSVESSYYNTPDECGEYIATITATDGLAVKTRNITIKVYPGGGEEEKKEDSGSSIKWDTDLIIQSFGGIAVFLVIGLLVVTIIKKILR